MDVEVDAEQGQPPQETASKTLAVAFSQPKAI